MSSRANIYFETDKTVSTLAILAFCTVTATTTNFKFPIIQCGGIPLLFADMT